MIGREVSRDEFLKIRPDRDHDEEFHDSCGATCQWRESGMILEEYQPDFGKPRWFVFKDMA